MTRQPTPNLLAEAIEPIPLNGVELVFGAPGATMRRDGLQDVPVGMIDDNPFQPREEYSGIEELAADIAANGLLQVPKGRRMPGGRVQLQYGHRRLRAAIHLGWRTMPVEVQTVLDDSDMAVRAWSENHNRQDFTAMDQARYFRKLLDAGWTQKQIAEKLNLSAPAVSNTLKLLRLPEDLQAAVAAGGISARQADALLSVCELPKDLRDRAEGFWDTRTSPTEIVQEALQGASSDSIRDRTRDLLQRFAEQIHEKPWYKHKFNPLDGEFKAISCASCPSVIKRDVGVFCSDRECVKVKTVVWGKSQLWLASQDSGIEIADDPFYSMTHHESFMYESNGPAVLAAEPRCKNLKVVLKADFVDRNIRNYHIVPGHPEALIVCQKAGNNQCLCLARLKRSTEAANPSKTKPAVLKKEIIAPATDLLAAKLAELPIGLLRIMSNRVRESHLGAGPHLEPDHLEDERLAAEIAEGIFKWHCSDWKSPDTNRAFAASILEFAGLQAPWAPLDAESINHRFDEIQAWLDDFMHPGDGLPTPVSMQAILDELNQLHDASLGHFETHIAMTLSRHYQSLWPQALALQDRVNLSYSNQPSV